MAGLGVQMAIVKLYDSVGNALKAFLEYRVEYFAVKLDSGCQSKAQKLCIGISQCAQKQVISASPCQMGHPNSNPAYGGKQTSKTWLMLGIRRICLLWDRAPLFDPSIEFELFFGYRDPAVRRDLPVVVGTIPTGSVISMCYARVSNKHTMRICTSRAMYSTDVDKYEIHLGRIFEQQKKRSRGSIAFCVC